MDHSPTSHKTATRLAAYCGLLLSLLLPSALFGQGCVIARGGGGASIINGSGYLEEGHWQLGFNLRHFKSHRHFAGDDEQTQRSDNGTEVYNDSWFYDTTVTYAWTKRFNLYAILPFVNHDRSSMYEHLGNNSGQRFSTQASGMADMLVGANYWVIDPNKAKKWNLQIGAGLKLPTGDAEVKDIFVKPAGPSERYVDSSIQPGDSGTGFTVSMQGYYTFAENWSFYGNGYYLFEPEERNEATGYSIPDGYMVRGGVEYDLPTVRGLAFSLGLRNEGVVAHDLFGGSLGFRRPGYAVSVEPGVIYSKGRFSGTLTVPIAVYRNRVPSYGQNKAGDAAFADYTINLSFTVNL